MTILFYILIVLLILGWLGVTTWFGSIAMDVSDLPFEAPRWIFGAAAALLFAIGLGLVLSTLDEDNHPHRLCVQGHQEWRTVHRAYPPAEITEKIWVCTQWENEQ